MTVLRFRLWLSKALLLGMAASVPAAPPALDFNRDIRPILSENCFYCHGQDANKRKADLRLDVREIALSSGAIVPQDAAASQLIARINSADPDEVMPPADSNRRLSAEQKTILQRWIAEGAAYARHWAFVAPRRPVEPEVRGAEWVRTPIDRFVLAKLEAEGLAPSPEADRPTLIKRLAIDLTGLPPTPEEVDAFVADADPQAYENLVERLLASPHYGERMALDWLDAARYADSNGFQQDGDTWQWIWRDWVVRAINADLPFDEFTVWQLAGDLLPDATNPRQTVDQKIASAFNRNHLLNGEGGAIAEEQRYVNLFDRIDTTATTWLGLTMACAQCHDHKYDPITQRDYYGLLDAFNRVPESGTPQFFSSRIRVANPVLELPTEANRAKFAELESQISAASAEAKIAADAAYQGWREGLFADGKPAEGKGLPEGLAAVLRKGEAERSEEEKKSLEPGLRKHFDEKVRPGLAGKIPSLAQVDALQKQLDDYRADKLPRLMVMSDERPRETTILNRGDYLSPGEKVSFATPAFLPPLHDDAPRNRLGFARWLVSPEHPLAARVQVNRMWQYFFGAGIVKTAEDFGVQSEYPIHGELLDWLAVEFRARGWSRKALHRLIVTSAAYRQSGRTTPEQFARDRENRLFARASRFRMPSMVLRDWALAAAGLLDGRIGGAPVYPYQPDAIWEALAITKERDFTYPASSGADLYRRSLYTFWRRTVGPANMFDASNRQTCRVRQAATSTPLHALTTLNDPTWVEAARMLAEASMKATANLDERLAYCFRRVVARTPAQQDLESLRRLYERQAAIYRSDAASAKALLGVGAAKRDESLDVSQHAALAAVCLAILNLDEALTRE
ncbi:MAG TPA: PSD1 and planctomycete cytochrome C domain-containing protein [Pirellulales bacterium]|nr:PSD1 and planctomycete cytochrome C domain-containing protein [Pirellulales bacterium]